MSDETLVEGHDESAEVRAFVTAMERASRWMDVERWDHAEAELARALALRPYEPYAHFQLARVALAREKLDLAASHARETIALAPEFAVAHGLLSVVARSEGRLSDAELHAIDALRLAHDEPWLYECYGDLMRMTGHLERARRLYERGLAYDPTSARLHALLALVVGEDKQHVLAQEHARRGLSHDPEDALAQASLAAALLQRGRPFAARAHLRESLRLDPTNTSVEELWREADRCCRVVYLPMYYWTLIVSRIPGHNWTVWGAFVVFAIAARRIDGANSWFSMVALGYFALCVYTWIARPIVNRWTSFFPAR